MPKKASDQYSENEAQKRFEAALRGARVTGPKPKAAKPGTKRDAEKKKRV